MKKENDIASLSIGDEHRRLRFARPRHPLISVLRFDGTITQDQFPPRFIFDFYSIAIKKNIVGNVRYGQRHFDFDSGVITFMAPNQLVAHSADGNGNPAGEGICLNVHPDFFSGYSLAKTIRDYSFFSYEMNEALHLSEQEEETCRAL